jgi:hypothetical protein
MSDTEINDHVDQQRWLINNGLFNDMHKDNLYLFGALVHKDVLALELSIDIATKTVKYQLHCSDRLFKALAKYNKLKSSDKLLDLWKLKRLLKKEGNLNFSILIDGMVKNFCGPSWAVIVEVKDLKDYEEEPYKPEAKEPIKAD